MIMERKRATLVKEALNKEDAKGVGRNLWGNLK